MDQGFWSYRLFWQIAGRNAYFAIRRFDQAHFKRVKKLGRNDYLVEWTPSDSRQRKDLPKSIPLRVIEYQIKGFRPTAVVTNMPGSKADFPQ